MGWSTDIASALCSLSITPRPSVGIGRESLKGVFSSMGMPDCLRLSSSRNVLWATGTLSWKVTLPSMADCLRLCCSARIALSPRGTTTSFVSLHLLQNQSPKSISPLTICLYSCWLMPDWHVRCCHLLHPSHSRPCCRGRTAVSHTTQLFLILAVSNTGMPDSNAHPAFIGTLQRTWRTLQSNTF